MRQIWISLSLVLLLTVMTDWASISAAKPKDAYRVMTCNIRITGLEADAPYPERVWENRRNLCVNTILKRKPDFFCLQEVIYDSYEYFKKRCSAYSSYGFVGPEMDAYSEGYHNIGKNVIFFRKDKFELVSSGCYWLSDSPLIGGSMSWGTTRARHCNWVRLREIKTGKEIRLLNVHLDHLSDSARREQIKLVINECAQYSHSFPQVMCGDFNSGIANAPILYIHNQQDWSEMYEDIHGKKEFGFTCHNFLGDQRKKKGKRIDFIFHRGAIETLSCNIVTDHEGTMYPSDHYFVDATFRIK